MTIAPAAAAAAYQALSNIGVFRPHRDGRWRNAGLQLLRLPVGCHEQRRRHDADRRALDGWHWRLVDVKIIKS